MSAVGRLEDDWDAAVEQVREWTGHPSESSGPSNPPQQEEPVTETPVAPLDAPVVPFWPAVHQNLDTFASRLATFLPKLRDMAENGYVADVIEGVLTATGQGMAAEEFAALVAVLKASPDKRLDAALALVRVLAGRAQAPAA